MQLKCRALAVALAVVFLLFLSGLASAETQGWINNGVSLAVTRTVGFDFSWEGRYGSAVYYGTPFLRNLQIAPVYKLPANAYLTVRYKREEVTQSSFISHENRVTYEGGWKMRLAEDLAFDTRLRFESRNFEEETVQDHLRYRFRVRVTYKLRFQKLHIDPFIATEPFGDDKGSTEVFLNRNRFYLGAGIPVTEKVKLVASYIRQDTRDKDTIHIMNMGIMFKL
ncbi:MAG: DUF2490 domain-containing protein [Candidatus Krumholzibacteria bacterium]|nr:DUF2490 domain-containing protein [Candidatus Krumholzibacteria bacterium]